MGYTLVYECRGRPKFEGVGSQSSLHPVESLSLVVVQGHMYEAPSETQTPK